MWNGTINQMCITNVYISEWSEIEEDCEKERESLWEKGERAEMRGREKSKFDALQNMMRAKQDNFSWRLTK